MLAAHENPLTRVLELESSRLRRGITGFGRAARSCAMRKRYDPARDREGRPVLGTCPPFTVKFER